MPSINPIITVAKIITSGKFINIKLDSLPINLKLFEKALLSSIIPHFSKRAWIGIKSNYEKLTIVKIFYTLSGSSMFIYGMKLNSCIEFNIVQKSLIGISLNS